MLLEFRVTNFRSICEEQVLSLRPAPKQKDYPANILEQGKYKALNALALYGPNDSGKSNLLRAINLLDTMVGTSKDWASTTPMPFDPFLLRAGWENKPTEFEITFVANDNRYRYGLSYKAAGVAREWLYRKAIGREVALFEREADTVEVGPGLTAASAKQKLLLDTAIEATRPNALFLSMCDSFNVPEAKQLIDWFGRLIPLDGLNTRFERSNTAELLEKSDLAQPIRDYLASLSLRVLGVEIKSREFSEAELPPGMPKTMRRGLTKSLAGKTTQTVMATHRLYDAEGKPTTKIRTWDWTERESAGAIKALEMSGPVVWALANGGVLVIDEIEAKLHTQLTLNTVNLFLNPATNLRGAQLLFATHDTNLLTYAQLRRDQICFAEKNAWEGTETYSLSDFQYLPIADGKTSAAPERPDTDKEKRYLEGRYGAIPATADFQRFVKQHPTWPVLEK